MSEFAGIVQDELRDLRGNALTGATVIVRQVGTTTPATVYNNPVQITAAGSGDTLVNDATTGIPAASGLLQPGVDAEANYTFFADSDVAYDPHVVWHGLTFDYRVRPKVTHGGTSGSDSDAVKRTGGGKEAVVTIDPAGSASTLDLADGNVFVIKNPVAAGTCTLTLTGATAGVSCGCTVVFHQRSSGDSQLAFAGTVAHMNDGLLPGPGLAANAVSEYSLRTLDGGLTWQAWKVGDTATAPASGLVSTFSYVYANNGLTKVVPANTFTNFLEIIDTIDTPGAPLIEFDLTNHRFHILEDCLVQFYGDLFWPDISSDPAASVYFRMIASDGHLWTAFVRSWAYENLPQFGYRFQTPIFKFTAGTTLTFDIFKSSAGMTVNYAEVWATAFTAG